MDEFIGHLDEERIQRLEDHLAETARLAGLFAEPFGMKDAGVLLGRIMIWESTVLRFRHI